jgi:hypothetical protein
VSDWRLASVLKHYVTYPIEIIGCLLPWSVFLFGFGWREIRRGARTVHQNLLFLIVSLAVGFAPLWFMPEALSRFDMPLYPSFAVLVGIVIHECARQKAGRVLWRYLLTGFAVLIGTTGLVVLLGSILTPRIRYLGQPIPFGIFLALLTSAAAAVAWRTRRDQSELGIMAGVLSIAAFAGLLYAGVTVNYMASKSEHAAEAVAALKQKLPPDVQLVSYGPVFHLFAYHYAKPILQLPVPTDWTTNDGVTYFCSMTEPPFRYEELGRISCDRNRSAHPSNVVIVGRRISGVAPSL